LISFGGERGDDPASPPRAAGQTHTASVVSAITSETPTCQRCGFPVVSRPWGCRNPCANCGTVYPLGDCSD
jgi:hypothetical protein